MNGSALVIASNFQGKNAKSDKNGKTPVLLVSIAGRMPNRSVLAGTIAESSGFEPGKKYMVSYTEGEPNVYGRQFSFTNEGEVSTVADTLLLKKEYGEPQIVQVDAAEAIIYQSDEPQKIKTPQPA